jgi:hypothetical protein
MVRNHHVFKDIKRGQETLPGEKISPSPETNLEFSINPSPLFTTDASCGSGLGGI